MRLPYDLIVFDLEANQPSNRIIEIGAVRLQRDMTIMDTFQTYCTIPEPLNPEITKLTQITDSVLAVSGLVPEIWQKQFAEWALRDTKNIVLASWSPYDVVQLKAQWLGQYPFRNKMIDIKSFCNLFARLTMQLKSDSLTTLIKALDITSLPAHQALNDAQMTARCFVKLISRYETNVSTLKALF